MTCYRTATRHWPRIAARRVLRGSSLGSVSSVPIDLAVEIDDEALFSTPDVCRLARVSFRQLDYWSRVGVITPEQAAKGSGSARRFTGAQARDVAMIGRLRELGVSLDAIEETLSAFATAEPGALLVIGAESVRVVDPLDIGRAVSEHGVAIVVSPTTLRSLDVAEQPVKRAMHGGRLPASAPRYRP